MAVSSIKKYQSSGAYQNLYEESIRNPKGFWARQAELIDWHKPFDKVLDDSRHPAWRLLGGQAAERGRDALGFLIP